MNESEKKTVLDTRQFVESGFTYYKGNGAVLCVSYEVYTVSAARDRLEIAWGYSLYSPKEVKPFNKKLAQRIAYGRLNCGRSVRFMYVLQDTYRRQGVRATIAPVASQLIWGDLKKTKTWWGTGYICTMQGAIVDARQPNLQQKKGGEKVSTGMNS